MKEKVLSCEGLPCPQPVLKCKKAIEEESPVKLKIIVDNEAAKENVCRFLKMQQYKVQDIFQQDNKWEIIAINTKKEASDNIEEHNKTLKDFKDKQQKILVFIAKDRIGQGDDTLGAKLMANFIATLGEMENLWRIILVNSGVRLSIEGSDVLSDLQKLESEGVSILVCGTCLDFFNLLDKKAVGQTTNMLDVVTSMQLADKVISL
ncbi:selenium metabolism protein YedF [Desulfonauticus submarinus]|uniref:Selenium metabolism protein YedF n=1 Tax=Desulfonauticus submarinus TaxID=206665 RepID=A0A1H0FUG8_9BACT|nr:sulfurtransferase-like selenium metabolism protein YedF [Desulfonauticus submarinus]SDN98212.1 selenium metabolism protein YedF [Desulfonauticus submarinus]